DQTGDRRPDGRQRRARSFGALVADAVRLVDPDTGQVGSDRRDHRCRGRGDDVSTNPERSGRGRHREGRASQTLTPTTAQTIRLAFGSRAQEQRSLDGRTLPALLVSYAYLDQFLRNRHRYKYRDWIMDSGAFTAANSGTVIRLADYIKVCHDLMAEDSTLVE